jgi:RNA polymerase sigma-70 factor, ECF subfamily
MAGVTRTTTPAAVATFEQERPRLIGLAYRLLGSIADAEDVVQETWVRWQRADPSTIERPVAWLTTVTSRIGLDRLRARHRERVDYVGPWLPEPIVESVDGGDPARAAELSDSLTTAFLLVLEELDPVERLVLLLADVFDVRFAGIAEITGKSESACRQIAVRARRRVRAAPLPSRSAASAEAAQVADRVVAAALTGDVDGLLAVMSPDVVLVSDGGRERHAARRPVIGADRVSRFLVNTAKRLPRDADVEPVIVSGWPGLFVRADERLHLLYWVVVEDGLVTRVEVIVNPTKLEAIEHGRHVDLV